MKYVLRRAGKDDLPRVARLYREAIGRPGSVWNENYPSQEEIDGDFAARTLMVFCNASDGADAGSPEAVIGAVSVVPENEYDAFDCFSRTQTHREIARITISREYAGRGLAARMVGTLVAALHAQGWQSVRLSVAKCNPAARTTYERLGFAFVGEMAMYGNDYFLCEHIAEEI